MGRKMRPSGRRPSGLFNLLFIVGFVLVGPTSIVRTQEAISQSGITGLNQNGRDDLTVLLVSARPGKSISPVGLIGKTARTFVQDGASTEYATQVLGTTLDNGRVYAQILSTSSRVFYEKDSALPESSRVDPFLVYPSRVAPQDEWKLFGGIIEDDGAGKREEAIIRKEISSSSSSSSSSDPHDRENDIFEVRKEFNVDTHPRFKPAKMRNANLPTYTVKQELVGGYSGSDDINEEDGYRNFKPRVPKIFKHPSARANLKKDPTPPLQTVTYHGFADFTTTVGDTIIVFSPSTSSAPPGRPATTIKGDATLRPGDGNAILIQPTSIVKDQKTIDPMLAAINGHSRPESDDLTPSMVDESEESSSSQSTPLLLLPENETVQPTGLIKVIDSTTSADGTTTHYKSLIYGTYVGTNYAQIIHTSSNVYFFPDEASESYDTTTTKFEEDTEDTMTTFGGDSTTSAATSADIDETLSPDINELTTLVDEVTENSPTTIKISHTTPMEPEILNDIIDPQGRSVKGGSPKNNLNNEEKKVEFATRLLPSTVYKTFTYFTTFFIPDQTHQDVTTTSVRSREVVSEEVTYLTELILPSATQADSATTSSTPSTSSIPVTSSTPPVESSNPKFEDEDSTTKPEEIELIFKTLYTTYTYLTTFFQESTSSVSSREVVETNVVTQTLGPKEISDDFIRLLNEDVTITPTKIADSIQPSIFINSNDDAVTYEVPTTIEDSVTESGLTTLMDLENENLMEENRNKVVAELEPSPMPNLATDEPKYETKTYFTTYTYFTSIFVDNETEIETRTEVFSNIVTEKIEPTAVVQSPEVTSLAATTPKSEPAPPPEILAYLEALKKQKAQQEASEDDKNTQGSDDVEQLKPRNQETAEKLIGSDSIGDTTEKVPVDGEVLGSMITDVISSSSSFDGPILEPPMDKRNVGSIPEDQELSESNHHEVEPAPTLLLRTSYTTYTYFTTMYKGDASDVTSRLETVTNVVTETIRPTPKVEISATIPVTYFTTFTYWTTFYRAGDTITTSREETVSNVVTPDISATPTVSLAVIPTYHPEAPEEVAVDQESMTEKTIADNEVMEQEKSTTPISVPKEIIYGVSEDEASIEASSINAEPVTYYTTFTYFTTSYIGDKTILNSRLETITSVSLGGIPKATGRAIGGSVSNIQDLEREEKVKSLEVTPTKVVEEPKTGLLSTIKSSDIMNGTTTHYSTDIYGTYIDGLYAQVVESTTSLEIPPNTPVVSPTSVATPALPTGVLSLNKGSVIDADKVTTVFFTTSQIGTLIDGLYAKVIESTSSTKIDAERKATLKLPEERHRTGLVRLIKGQIEVDGSTVIYQSKVIGTSIEGRYAQIIESTSSYILPSATISPTEKISLQATLAPGLPSPAPAAIQSSISDGNQDDISDEDENEGDEDGESEDGDELDENGQKDKKKSRLTFSSRKRTFTPAIRPFLSRSRPTFNPKRKGAQGATTITRTDITPTITATLAGSKGNRFASSRGRPVSSVSPTASINSSRRFAGRRNPSSSIPVSATSVRGRTSGRISASPTYSVSRRGPSSIRGSSARPAVRGSSSIYPGASSRFRGVIRPSSTLVKPLQTVNPSQIIKSDDQEDEANEFTATTLVTEETPYPTNFDDFEETATTVPIKTTTESSRRSTNPLLRFRRPVNIIPTSRGTPPPRRATTSTTKSPSLSSRSSNARSLNSPTLPPFSPRSRGSNRLFPPRNFINQRQSDPIEGIENGDENNTNIEDDKLVEEIIDNDYEGSENNKRRRVPTRSETTSTTPRTNRFFAQRRRSKRQVTPVRSYQPHRYRRPIGKSAEDRSDVDSPNSNVDEESTTKSGNRYSNTRGRSLSTVRPPIKSSSEKHPSESNENSNIRTRRPTAPRVKPTPTTPSTGRQFTLREKNLTYKRPSAKQQDTNRRPSSRVRTTGRRTTESSFDTRRSTTSRSSSRTRNNNRRILPRGRGGSREDLSYWKDDGIITVTHYIPTEVSIPVVANGVTEFKNIITPSPSVEILGPEKYNTVTGGDGRPLIVIARESSGINHLGQTEVTRFLLHSTPTSRVSHTLTSVGGRRVSQSLIVPSTVYSVENVVSTIPASINNQNSPLANILLSQLLLGQLGQPSNIQPTDTTPTTQYKTRTTTYVTTITKEKSTVIPLTFRGKEILTTLSDSSTNVVTATEFITDTVVVTPTVTLQNANLNSLLLLLQQTPQAPQQAPVQDPLFAAAPIFSQSNSLPGETERKNQPVDLDYRPDDDSSASVEEFDKPVKPKDKLHKKEAPVESSVVTLYVSDKRPGEFSTILSTVKAGGKSTALRRRRDLVEEVRPSIPPSLYGQPEATTSDDAYGDIFYGQKYSQRVHSDDYLDEKPEDYVQDKHRKVIRVRVPSYVSREKPERQHKYTVVRKRPLVSYTKPINYEEVIPASSTPRRIVITRVRNLGARSRKFFDDQDLTNYPVQNTYSRKHKVTVTRTRKLRPTLNVELTKIPRTRVTRKKLVTVRPVITSTPTYAIITTGFYGISDDEVVEENEEEEEEEEPEENFEDTRSELEESEKISPGLVSTVNTIEEKPIIEKEEEEEDEEKEVEVEGVEENPLKFELDIPEESVIISSPTPVIITDNFFFPASSEDDDINDSDINDNIENEEVDEKYTSTTEESKNEEIEDNNKNIESSTEKNESIENNSTGNGLIETTTESLPVLVEEKIPEQIIKNIKELIEEKVPEEMIIKEENPITEEKVIEVNMAKTESVEEEETSKSIVDLEEVSPKSIVNENKIPKEVKMTEKELIEQKTPELMSVIEETPSKSIVIEEKIPEEITTTIKKELISESTTSTTSTTMINEIILEPSTSSTSRKLDKSSSISIEDPIEQLTVVPLDVEFSSSSLISSSLPSEELSTSMIDIIPSVIPLESSMSIIEDHQSILHQTESLTTESSRITTTLVASPTPEEIEAGLSDELYLSLSRPDLPKISSSSKINKDLLNIPSNLEPHPTPTVIFTETIVTSTRLRTYTYVVTKLNGLETEVTSSTTVRPRVTTLTLTVPVTIVPTSIDKVEPMHLSTITTASGRKLGGQESKQEAKMMDEDAEGEGRRLKLATRIMSNGVEVIVAGPTPALRWENSNPQPTLTLSDAVVMLMPQEDPNEFVTKTCTTTFTYLNTITKDGTTIVSTDQQVIANTATEERHRKPGSESAAVTLAASPTLRTEVFKTTYTYLTLNTDHPDADNALSSSQKVITNTVTAPQHYLDMILEPSEAPPPQTNTYLSTRVLEKTFIEDGITKIETRSDMITRLIITESVPPPPRPTSVTTTLTALDDPEDTLTDNLKTHYVTYNYYDTYLNIKTSTDVSVEKIPKKTEIIDMPVVVTLSPEPIKIFATKTYLTTFTYFTTLLQAGPDGETSTIISSRSNVVKSVVTESIAPSLLHAGYINLLTTSHHSDLVKNVVTGSTIIYFDEEDQIDSSSTSTQIQPTVSLDSSEAVIEHSEITSTHSSDVEEAQKDEPEKQPNEQNVDLNVSSSSVVNHEDSSVVDSDVAETNDGSDSSVGGGLLSLGSLGINGLSALGPVITAMAGLLQGKPTSNRRNDTIITPSSPPVVHREPPEVTTPRSPIYIPVSEFADGDIDTAESQNIAAHLANPNPNFIPETRHKLAASIVDGIPISPGEVITANSDVIIGKPGILSPRPPQTYFKGGKDDQNFGMKPPPISAPNIPVHPVLEVIKDDELTEPSKQLQHVLYPHSKRPPKIPIKSASKHDILENDPLLKPPGRPNIEKYANPNINPKEPEWIIDRLRRPWSSQEGLIPPPVPSTPSKVDEGTNKYVQGSKPWPNRPVEDPNRHTWVRNDPIITAVNIEGSEVKPEATEALEPIIHQVPHVIDRSTGQPLLVNIQPSQVANVVIPQGGTQALIFGDTSEPHISGQYFDDPSPYPEPEGSSGFLNFDRPDNNPADFMIPPAPPSGNYKPAPQKPHPHTIPISNTRVFQKFPRPHDKIEIPTNNRPDKRPSDILLIQRPESHGQSSQGQVHTEILVHHSSDVENIHGNVRPQSNQHQASFPPPRRDYYKPPSNDQLPPRRTADISPPTDTLNHHRYTYYHEKPNRTLANDILKQKWKNNHTKQRITVIRQRPPLRRPAHYSHPDRAPGYGTKLKYSPYRPVASHISQASHPQQIPINWQEETKITSPSSPAHHQETQGSAENLPTGAIGYRNPLIGNAKRPMSPVQMQPTNYQPSPPQHHQVHQLPPDISPPVIQSFGQILPRPDDLDISWSDTQTEAGLDSTAEESEEHIKFQQASHYHNQYQTHTAEINQHDPENVVIRDEVEEQEKEDEVQSQNKNNNTEKSHNVGSLNTEITVNIAQPVSYGNQTESLPENHNNYPLISIESSSGVYEDNVEMESQEHEHITEEKPDYDITQDESFGIKTQVTEERPDKQDDTMDLRPPVINPQFLPEKSFEVKPAQEVMQTAPSSVGQEQQSNAENNLHLNPPGGHARPHSNTWGTVKETNNENEYYSNSRNLTIIRPTYSHDNSESKYVNTEIIRTTETTTSAVGTRVHPAYPHILTIPRPVVPGPITISTGSSKVRLSLKNKKNNESSQAERPKITMRPVIIYTKDKNRETLETAFQTNFAIHEEEENVSNIKRKQMVEQNNNAGVPSQDMMPPPPTTVFKDKMSNDDAEADLKPPPIPSDVVGMSPPPVAITSTIRRPVVNTVNGSGLRSPPKYIPLNSSKVVGETPPPPPSLSSSEMIPPTIPRPTKSRPFLIELLSQDMVPPRPPVIESSRPIEITTVRPAIAVSGSIQIATAVAASHIPVMQDIVESTIPIIHGTVDLPVVMDVSEIINSIETKRPEHVSVYTVRPFETKQISRVSVQPTTIVSTNLIMPTRVRFTHIGSTSTLSRSSVHTKIPSHETSKKSSIKLEASRQSILPNRVNSTQSLSYRPHTIKQSINPSDVTFTTTRRKYGGSVTKVRSSIAKTVKEIIVEPTVREKSRNVTTVSTMTKLEIKPKAVTHFKTLTVTRTETSVLGSPPTTRTLLLTHTLTSTIVETVTETLLRPTNVVITSVTTILQPITRLPTYENSPDNMDSIFVVMSDQNPPAADAEEVEAEYGTEEEVSRDEQEPAGSEIHRVLSGSILGSPMIPHWVTTPQCQPECKSAKAEMCSQIGGEARCICRPGFARLFPDRPCKPTYTYTLRIGLDRIGKETIRYSHGINNTTSPMFKKLTGPIREALDRTLMQSDLRDIYRSLNIAKFHPNPLQVEFHVQLSDNTNENKLKEVLQKYLISSNYSLGGTDVYASRDLDTIDSKDFDECLMEEGGPYHDCSSHATCFNLRGSYQCSCLEGWADLSENSAYPGRVCSQAPLGCTGCNNKGQCVINSHGQEICECFPWHSGQRCQVNLKVLLIALVTTGAILLGLLGVCLALACFRHPERKGKSGDRRAMIATGTGGDTSSEGSVADLAIPHHVPHVLPPPPRSAAPVPPSSKRPRKATKQYRAPKKPSYAGAQGTEVVDQERSLSVMIPRAKYRSGPHSPQNYPQKPPMSTFAAEEHKLINYLEGNQLNGNRKASVISTTKEYVKNYEETGIRAVRNPTPNNGALVSAGFQVKFARPRKVESSRRYLREEKEEKLTRREKQKLQKEVYPVSATVMKTVDDDSTLDDTFEPSTMKTLRSTTDFQDGTSTLARSCDATTIQATTKLLPLDSPEENSSVGRSCAGDTSIKQQSPSRGSKDTRDARDSASEGPITAERDLGSTLRLRHTPLYNPDRAASDRDSNFDSL